MSRQRRDTFMDVQMSNKQDWTEIDSSNGTFYVDGTPDKTVSLEFYRDYCEFASQVYGVKKIRGYGVRLSAAGYLDCTDWEVYTNKREAMQRAREMDEENQEANNPDF